MLALYLQAQCSSSFIFIKYTDLGNLRPRTSGIPHLLETVLLSWRPRCVCAALLGRWRWDTSGLGRWRELNGRSDGSRRCRRRRFRQGRTRWDGRRRHRGDCAGSGSGGGDRRRDDGRGRSGGGRGGRRLHRCGIRPLTRPLGHGRRCWGGDSSNGWLLL